MKSANNSDVEKKYKKLLERERRAKKRKYAPKGGTRGAQAEHARMRHFYAGAKKKAKIRVIDKTKK